MSDFKKKLEISAKYFGMQGDTIAQKASVGSVVCIQPHDVINRENTYLILGLEMRFKTRDQKKNP